MILQLTNDLEFCDTCLSYALKVQSNNEKNVNLVGRGSGINWAYLI